MIDTKAEEAKKELFEKFQNELGSIMKEYNEQKTKNNQYQPADWKNKLIFGINPQFGEIKEDNLFEDHLKSKDHKNEKGHGHGEFKRG